MTHILKNNFARILTGGMLAVLFALFALSSKTSAAGYHLYVDSDFPENNATTTSVYLKASGPSELQYLTAYVSSLTPNLTFSSFTANAGMASSAIEENIASKRFTFSSMNDPLLLNSDDTVLTATFNISDDADEGSYGLQICPELARFATDINESQECTTVYYAVYASSQSMYYPEDDIEKNLGDTPFINPLSATHVAGGLSYRSTNEDVATVDPATGEVTIVGVGDTEIIATAAAYGRFYETTASYTLSVVEGTPAPAPTTDPEPESTPESTDEATIAVPDTGRSTSENNATNVASIIGIASIVLVVIALVEKRVTKKKVKFTKK